MEETIVQLKQSALDAGVDVNATQVATNET